MKNNQINYDQEESLDITNQDTFVWLLEQINNKIESIWKEELKRIIAGEGQD